MQGKNYLTYSVIASAVGLLMNLGIIGGALGLYFVSEAIKNGLTEEEVKPAKIFAIVVLAINIACIAFVVLTGIAAGIFTMLSAMWNGI